MAHHRHRPGAEAAGRVAAPRPERFDPAFSLKPCPRPFGDCVPHARHPRPHFPVATCVRIPLPCLMFVLKWEYVAGSMPRFGREVKKPLAFVFLFMRIFWPGATLTSQSAVLRFSRAAILAGLLPGSVYCWPVDFLGSHHCATSHHVYHRAAAPYGGGR